MAELDAKLSDLSVSSVDEPDRDDPQAAAIYMKDIMRHMRDTEV